MGDLMLNEFLASNSKWFLFCDMLKVRNLYQLMEVIWVVMFIGCLQKRVLVHSNVNLFGDFY